MSKIVQNAQELRVKSEPVASVEEATELIDKLTKAVRNTSNGLGLAAVQIGMPKQVGVIEYNGETVHLINPRFVEGLDEFVFPNEGCLSFPGEFLNTKRYRQYTIDNTVIEDGEFKIQRQCYWFGDPGDSIEKGMVAIAVQHEMDHFAGRLIIDHGFKSEPVQRENKKIGRNDPCPCGSGKKYKKCCG